MPEIIPIAKSEYVAEYTEYARKHCLISGFWDNIFTNTDRYCIKCGNDIIGFTSIFRQENMLTAFFIREGWEYYVQQAFDCVKSELSPAGARVMTNDEIFLSAALEHAREVNQQAYLFALTDRSVKPARYPSLWFRAATDADIEDLTATDFYDSVVIDNPENQIYVLRDDSNTFLGTGHIYISPVKNNCGAVGMYTAPEFRNKGIAHSIITFLTEIVKCERLVPIACCNTHNIASRKTLESCGYTTNTRYINLIFHKE